MVVDAVEGQAAALGVLMGDKVEMVGRKSTKGMSVETVVAYIRKQARPLHLRFRRAVRTVVSFCDFVPAVRDAACDVVESVASVLGRMNAGENEIYEYSTQVFSLAKCFHYSQI